MKKVLTKIFFNRPTLEVAKELLGKFLVRKSRGREVALMITEVEAYDGPKDKASHASPVRSQLLRGFSKNRKD
ncbi:MAG: DNA-3-methyladenine glycosylase, partial [bacterium]|nr:DNA-3-methyladenine glycosylase [bacterium]